MERYGQQPTPEVPKYHVLASVHFAIQHQFATPTYEVNDMPGKVAIFESAFLGILLA